MNLTIKKIATIIWVLLMSPGLFAQSTEDFTWPDGKRAAVCLTYDDGLDCHLDVVGPVLDEYGFKGTFFCTGSSQSIANRTGDWRDLSGRGHELGNHTLFHPCIKNLPGRGSFDWVRPEYDLDTYSFPQLMSELRTANALLKAIDGKTERTFAYTCVDHTIQGVDFADSIQHMFVAARADGSVPDKMDEVDLYMMPSYGASDVSGEDLIAKVKKAQVSGTVATFMFHSVGGGYLNVSAEAHRELLQYLKSNEEVLWVDTFGNVCKYIREIRKNH